MKNCPRCSGRGHRWIQPELDCVVCHYCGGTGKDIRVYDNPKRFEKAVIFRDQVLVERHNGQFEKDTSQFKEFVSCIHSKSPTPEAAFGGGMCTECVKLLEDYSQELEDLLIKKGWKKAN